MPKALGSNKNQLLSLAPDSDKIVSPQKWAPAQGGTWGALGGWRGE